MTGYPDITRETGQITTGSFVIDILKCGLDMKHGRDRSNRNGKFCDQLVGLGFLGRFGGHCSMHCFGLIPNFVHAHFGNWALLFLALGCVDFV